MKIRLYLFVAALLFTECSNSKKIQENEVVIFCASSLTWVISEIALKFEKEYQVNVQINLASSGTLARQIEYGAEPAVFISANKKWLDYLNELGKTIPEFEKKIAGNSMVMIVPLNSALNSFVFSREVNFPELFMGRLSIGDPQHVPAGFYTVQIFENLGYKEIIESRLFPSKDARSALMIIEMGEADAGIVFKTDALKSGKVKIITEFPNSMHEPVGYYMALIQGQKNSNSLDFYHYILSDSAKIIWEKFGFTH